MRINLIPRVEAGRWCGSALTHSHPPTQRFATPDDVTGGVICIQWLGFMVEIGAGRVR